MIQKISNEVYQNIYDRHPHHIGLDDWIVAHRNCVYSKLADAIPHKDALNDCSTAQKAAD